MLIVPQVSGEAFFSVSYLFRSDVYTLDNCAYKTNINESDTLVGCIYMLPYACDDYWAMDFGLYDAELDSQVIKMPQIISSTTSETTICFEDRTFNSTCERCFAFSSISFTGDSVTANLDYTYLCDQEELMELAFGTVEGEGVACGEIGYFYPSCSFRLPPKTEKLAKTVLDDSRKEHILYQNEHMLTQFSNLSQPRRRIS